MGHAGKFVTTIAIQLARSMHALRKHIVDAVSEHSDIISLSLRDQWHVLVLGPLSKLEGHVHRLPFVLVVDALDECDDDRDIEMIVQLIADARLLKAVQLRIFLTSRREIPIRHEFSQVPDSEYKLTVKLEPYTPPSVPVRKLLPSSPIASVFQGFERIHTQENSFNKRNKPIEPMESKTVNLLRCSKCSRSFEDSANLAYHTKKVHTIEDTSKKIIQIFNPPSAKPFELLRCHICHKAFESATNRDYHIRRNHLIQCPSCSRDFEGPRNLAHHMTQSHPTGPKYYVYISQDHNVGLIKCPKCNNRFQSSENLAWHIKHAHLIIMLRKCPQCHMSFKTHPELEKHFKDCHPGGSMMEIGKPQSSYHGCVKCNKTFSCQESLSTHEREKHGSGHFTTQKLSSYSQQIEEATQDSCSEKTTKTSIDRAEQEEYDRALTIRLQGEEEEKERALREQDKEREECDKHGPSFFNDLFGVPEMSTQDGIVSRIEEAETAISAYRDVDKWVEAILDQAEQD